LINLFFGDLKIAKIYGILNLQVKEKHATRRHGRIAKAKEAYHLQENPGKIRGFFVTEPSKE